MTYSKVPSCACGPAVRKFCGRAVFSHCRLKLMVRKTVCENAYLVLAQEDPGDLGMSITLYQDRI
jgi:hypothetical protein